MSIGRGHRTRGCAEHGWSNIPRRRSR